LPSSHQESSDLPLYFFHSVENERLVVPDNEGSDLADPAEAQTMALRAAAELVVEATNRGQPALDAKIIVEDENFVELFSLNLSVSIRIDMRANDPPES
jgi:hypothetical protein